ncbi:MAG: Rieske 2Fe-2S domain-containing protein [Nostoc sp. ChiSLP01]|nr:aromatic ring-hydroxylating dioxygenase subunit alpha [Nostoc sp. CmiSLP01]MDZ8285970.1 aromatic ring-hydroxylating dioxygenase subunit alpha [Nostoc sp. ChiSLP01]
MLKNFWYACEFSTAVTNQPKQIRMLNQQFVLYRNSQGQVVALQDKCPHRGAALSLGWVDDGCIRCPYHGWKFQADGQCIEIPANSPETPIPKRAHIEGYPIQEKYGFIWLFYGDLPEAERPPIPTIPEFEDPTMHPIFLEVEVKSNYTRVIENALCPAHIATVHANSFGWGFKQDPKIEPYEVEEEPWGISARITYKNFTKPKGIFRLFFRPSKTVLKAKTNFFLPNVTRIESDFSRGKVVNYAIHLPVDDRTTLTKRIQFRSVLTNSWADKYFLKFHYQVCNEDRIVTESQYPQEIPDNLADEIHTPSDALSIAYRKLRQKYLALGWGLKPAKKNKLEISNGHVAESAAALKN